MIKKIQIANYKSINTLEFELGRINVLIGENGAGKSNILEAIALAGAAAANKLDNEFLTSRGIRVTRPEYMWSAFPSSGDLVSIKLTIESDENGIMIQLSNDNTPYSKWLSNENIKVLAEHIYKKLDDIINENDPSTADSLYAKIFRLQLDVNNSLKDIDTKKNPYIWIEIPSISEKLMTMMNIKRETFSSSVKNFILYSPENSSLRTFQREGQIEPLGINGEGLLKLLFELSKPEYVSSMSEIKDSLHLLGWFEDLRIANADSIEGNRLEIKDRYLEKDRQYFDQLSTNEGFLFLLFYFALFSTDLTPKFFAIDNIDASLNPKLCEKLMRELVKSAEKHDKQVIFTTHNPAILDGLNLDDDEQRLFVVSRNANGATRMKRISKRKTPAGERPTRLSEMFLRGILGGLPKEF